MNKVITPSSLPGIKRLAKEIKSERDIHHHEALDVAAQHGGFQNFRHARNILETHVTGHRLYLTAYWFDRKLRARPANLGRETLTITLQAPFTTLCSRTQMKRCTRLNGLRLAAPDHLVLDLMGSSQSYVQEVLLQAARAIIFMEATGLQPAKDDEGGHPNHPTRSRPPAHDHPTHWVDPSSGQQVLAFEPYWEAAEKADLSAWSEHTNWHVRASKWRGMYYPDRCGLFLATDASTGFDFDAMMEKIDALEGREPANEGMSWTGASIDTHDVFYSPMAKTAQDRRRAKAQGTIMRFPGSKTIPYKVDRRRPKASLDLEKHIKIGALIKRVLAPTGTIHSFAALDRLGRVRSTLEDWMVEEHRFGREPDDLNPISVYYEAIDAALIATSTSIEDLPSEDIKALQFVSKTLAKSYNDCEPLRDILHRLSGAIKAIEAAQIQAA